MKNEAMYEKAIVWIVQHRGGGGGHPAREIERVSGWICVQLIAALFERPVPQVARDIIDFEEMSDDNRSQYEQITGR
jgi:hypothetical protein